MPARARLTAALLALATLVIAPVALAAPAAPAARAESLGGRLLTNTPLLGRVVTFSGYQWQVKSSTSRTLGPGPNYWSSDPQDVYIDSAHHLHLRIDRIDQTWYSAEVDSIRTMGYGTYRWVIEGDVTRLDRNVSIGTFTYDVDPAEAHREIDIEHSRWAIKRYPFSSQFVVQPFGTPDRQNIFNVPASTSYVQQFTWTPQGVTFSITPGTDPTAVPAHTWQFKGQPPSTSNEKTSMNYWLVGGRPPLVQKPSELVVDSFQFFPLGLPIASPS